MGPSEIQTYSRDAGKPEPHTAAEVVAALRAISRALQQFLIAQARATGIPLLEFLVLIRAAEGDGIIARDAGRELRLNTSTMTGLTDRLERDNLIRRASHPADRRLLLLRATPKGRKAVQRALGPLLAQLTALADTLEADHRASLGGFLGEASALVLQQAKTVPARPTRRAVARARASC